MPGSCGVLEGDPDAVARRALRHLVHRGDHAGDPGLEPVSPMRAGVNDNGGQAQGLGALQLVREHIDRPAALGPAGGEIDQVARMGEDRPDAGGPRGVPEGPDLLRPECRRRPLPLILQEDLDRAAAEIAATLQCLVQAAGNRHVRPEIIRSPRCPRVHRQGIPSAAGAGLAPPGIVLDAGGCQPRSWVAAPERSVQRLDRGGAPELHPGGDPRGLRPLLPAPGARPVRHPARAPSWPGVSRSSARAAASPTTSSVCSPRRGGGRRTLVGVSEKRSGLPRTVMRPAAG